MCLNLECTVYEIMIRNNEHLQMSKGEAIICFMVLGNKRNSYSENYRVSKNRYVASVLRSIEVQIELSWIQN